MDTIETCVLCFAIDCDNNVDRGHSEFHSLITRMPGCEPRRQVTQSDDVEKVCKGPNRARAYFPHHATHLICCRSVQCE